MSKTESLARNATVPVSVAKQKFFTLSKTESEAPPLARNAMVPVSVAKQECPPHCRKLNLVGLKPTRTIGEDEAIHLRLEAVKEHAFQILQAR